MPKPFARPSFPDKIVQDYGKAIIKEVNLIDKLIKDILYPQLDKITNTKSERLDSTIRLDLELKQLAGVALVAELIRRVKSKFYGEFLAEDEEPTQKLFTKSTRKLSRTFLDRTKEFTEKKFVAEFKRQTGTKPLHQQLNVEEFVKDATRKNVSLIKTIPSFQFAQIETLTSQAVDKGQLSKTLRDELLEISSVSKNRARLIARDQIGKLVGTMEEARQKKTGVTKYIWRDVEDQRVRVDHVRLNGTVQKWNDPPVTVSTGKRAGEKNHPGQDIQCRCHAQPVYDKITGIPHPDTKAAEKRSKETEDQQDERVKKHIEKVEDLRSRHPKVTTPVPKFTKKFKGEGHDKFERERIK